MHCPCRQSTGCPNSSQIHARSGGTWHAGPSAFKCGASYQVFVVIFWVLERERKQNVTSSINKTVNTACMIDIHYESCCKHPCAYVPLPHDCSRPSSMPCIYFCQNIFETSKITEMNSVNLLLVVVGVANAVNGLRCVYTIHRCLQYTTAPRPCSLRRYSESFAHCRSFFMFPVHLVALY